MRHELSSVSVLCVRAENALVENANQHAQRCHWLLSLRALEFCCFCFILCWRSHCVYMCVKSLFCYNHVVLAVVSGLVVVSLRKRELVDLLKLYSCCHVTACTLSLRRGHLRWYMI